MEGLYAKYIKRLMDVFISLAVLLLFWWLYGILVVAVGVNLGLPVFFVQERPGKGGKIFKMYKFRSMSNEKGVDGMLLPDKERLNRFGRLLRSSSLDELPELINVLKGDMSLVGPRPLLVEYLAHYNSYEMRRCEVRPGLTGLAQVCGRNAATWKSRFEKDYEYAEKICFALDVRILFLTINRIFIRQGVEYKDEKTIMDYFNSADRVTLDEGNGT